MRDTSVVQIDLSAIEHNVGVLRQIVGKDVLLCPIVKADAYGLGSPRIAKKLMSAGADMLAVYTTEQAAELVKATVTSPILVLMPVWELNRTDELYRALVAGRLHLVIHGRQHLEAVINIAEQFGAVLPVHVEVDTGMCRGGSSIDDSAAIFKRIATNRWVRLAGVFTHFIESEGEQKKTDEQLKALRSVIHTNKALIPSNCIVHAANSFAVLRHSKYHLDMVRIGLSWAGYGVESLTGGDVITQAQGLCPVMTWSSWIVHTKRVPKGASIGYGSKWKAERDSIVALIPVGYADGYPIGKAKRGKNDELLQVGVLLDTPDGMKRTFVPVVGAVNMDQITIDVTDLPEVQCGIGSTVELISSETNAPNSIPRLAKAASTFSHEMLCRINPRIRRVHLIRMIPAASNSPEITVTAGHKTPYRI